VSGTSADPPWRLLPPGAGERLGADQPVSFFLFLVRASSLVRMLAPASMLAVAGFLFFFVF
jgi:hypothetical protein